MDSQKQGCFNIASFGHDECSHRVGEDVSGEAMVKSMGGQE